MARPKSPDSRSVTLATRVSEATAGVIDVQRGPATRSEWLEGLIRGELADERWRHERDPVLCHHRACHKLSCDEYDALRERAAGHCEICGIAEEETPRGTLEIDHYTEGGIWYVRGLLCGKCNGGVMACFDGNKKWGENRKWEAKAAEYVARSWHRPDDRVVVSFSVEALLHKTVAGKAQACGETVTDVIERAFRAYIRGDSLAVAPAQAVYTASPPVPEVVGGRPCRHPSASVTDGVCGACGTEVW